MSDVGTTIKKDSSLGQAIKQALNLLDGPAIRSLKAALSAEFPTGAVPAGSGSLDAVEGFFLIDEDRGLSFVICTDEQTTVTRLPVLRNGRLVRNYVGTVGAFSQLETAVSVIYRHPDGVIGVSAEQHRNAEPLLALLEEWASAGPG